jgi:nucleotide-binding universal stress UspA family protein
MFRKILVPLDGSPLAEAVLPYVRELALCTNSEIVLLRVATYPVYDYSVTEPSLIIGLRENMLAEASSYINNLASALTRDGFNVTSEVAEGPVVEAIVSYVASVSADLIAMSTHGRTGIQRMFLGSVANRVVHESTVPVLLIRPQNAEREELAHVKDQARAV